MTCVSQTLVRPPTSRVRYQKNSFPPATVYGSPSRIHDRQVGPELAAAPLSLELSPLCRSHDFSAHTAKHVHGSRAMDRRAGLLRAAQPSAPSEPARKRQCRLPLGTDEADIKSLRHEVENQSILESTDGAQTQTAMQGRGRVSTLAV
jgi:hypothetical protein